MKKNCLQCGSEYSCRPAKAHISKFCSVPCRCAYEKIHGKIKLTDEERKTRYKQPEREFICQGCGDSFKAKGWKERKYCTRQCSMSTIGKRPTNSWTTGLDMSDPKLKSAIDKHAKTLKKRYADGDIETWNKGLTKDTDERVAQYVKSQTTFRNTDSPAKDAWKKALSKGQVQAHAAGKYPHTFTKPEQLTWEYLESLGLTVKAYADKSDDDPINTWYHQYPFEKFVPDFACPDLKCIIEVDGCAYHAHSPDKCQKPEAKYGWTKFANDNAKRDRKKHWFYHSKGWKWANVWECEADAGDFHRIRKYLNV